MWRADFVVGGPRGLVGLGDQLCIAGVRFSGGVASAASGAGAEPGFLSAMIFSRNPGCSASSWATRLPGGRFLAFLVVEVDMIVSPFLSS